MEYLDGEYREIREISRTKNGRVFLAEHKRTSETWAVKQIFERPNMRELEILKKLDHHALPTIRDYFADDDKSDKSEKKPRKDTYVVMKYIDGETLRASPFPTGVTPEAAVRSYMVQLCDVFSYLHGHNPPIIHKDVKPSNLIRDRTGHLYLIDFGISKDSPDVEIIGLTSGFAAPEQYDRNAITDERTDIYSIGATMYYLLSKVKPEIPARPLSEMKSDSVTVSEGLEWIIMKCLRPKPEDRYQSIAEFKTDMQNAHTFTKDYRALMAKRKRNIVISAVCTLLFSLIITFGAIVIKGEKEQKYKALANKITTADSESALIAFESSRRLYPYRPEGFIELSRSYLAQEKYEDSATLLEFALGVPVDLDNPGLAAQFYNCLGMSYDGIGQYESALRYFKLAISNQPDDAQYKINLIVFYRKWEMDDEAEYELNQLGEDSYKISYIKANVYNRQNDFENARNEYIKCLHSTDDELRSKVYIEMADMYGKNPDIPDSFNQKIAYLEQAKMVGFQDHEVDILHMLGEAYLEKGMDAPEQIEKEIYFTSALEKFQSLNDRYPGNLDTVIIIAGILKEMGRYNECREVLSRAVEEYESDYRPLFYLADIERLMQSQKSQNDQNFKAFEEYAKAAIKMAQVENDDIRLLRIWLNELNLEE